MQELQTLAKKKQNKNANLTQQTERARNFLEISIYEILNVLKKIK